MINFFKKYRYSLFIILALLASILPLFKSGFPLGHDFLLEIVRIAEYKHALITQGIPRLAPDIYMGYGAPVFVFYSPLFLLLNSIISFFYTDTIGALKVTVILLNIAGSFAMYKFLESHVSRNGALFGAILFIFTPYKFVDLFSRNAFAEYTAFMIFPLVLWTISEALTYGKIKNYILCFVCLALFGVSHNITVMLGIPCIFCVFLYLAYKEFGTLKNRRVLEILVCMFLALGAVMFFFLPALTEGYFVRLGDLIMGKFAFDKNFVDLTALLFDTKNLIYTSPIIFLIPLLNIYACIKKPKEYFSEQAGFLAFMLATVSFCMMFAFSAPLWNIFPVLHLVQFPWRFMVLVSLFGIWNASYLFDFFLKKRKKLQILLLIITTLTLATAYLLHYKDWDYYRESIPTPNAIATENKRTTVGDEYLTREASEAAKNFSTKAALSAGSPNTYRICVSDLHKQESVTFPVYYFPYWKAYQAGKSLDIDTSYPLVRVPISTPGCVELRLEFTFSQKLGWGITLFSIVLFCIWMMFLKRNKKTPL